jgi:hypothetical protein
LTETSEPKLDCLRLSSWAHHFVLKTAAPHDPARGFGMARDPPSLIALSLSRHPPARAKHNVKWLFNDGQSRSSSLSVTLAAVCRSGSSSGASTSFIVEPSYTVYSNTPDITTPLLHMQMQECTTVETPRETVLPQCCRDLPLSCRAVILANTLDVGVLALLTADFVPSRYAAVCIDVICRYDTA